ncbi:hypothetical protein GN956_G5163 [Arapaima gigas]
MVIPGTPCIRSRGSCCPPSTSINVFVRRRQKPGDNPGGLHRHLQNHPVSSPALVWTCPTALPLHCPTLPASEKFAVEGLGWRNGYKRLGGNSCEAGDKIKMRQRVINEWSCPRVWPTGSSASVAEQMQPLGSKGVENRSCQHEGRSGPSVRKPTIMW